MILHRCVSFDVPFRLPGHFSTLRRYRRRTSLEMLWVFGSLERQTLSDLFVLCCDVVYLAVVCGGQREAAYCRALLHAYLSSSPIAMSRCCCVDVAQCDLVPIPTLRLHDFYLFSSHKYQLSIVATCRPSPLHQ